MVLTYDPSQLVITFGPVLMSGFADGDMVSIEFNEDAFTLQMGTDGKGTRTKTSNRSGRVTVSLMQSSMCNDLLSGIHQLDDTSNQGVFPLLIKDLSGRTVVAAESAWITRQPAQGFGKQAAARAWVLESDNLKSFVGGQ